MSSERAGEDEPPAPFEWPWPAARAAALDAFGQTQSVAVRDGELALRVGITPVFIAPD